MSGQYGSQSAANTNYPPVAPAPVAADYDGRRYQTYNGSGRGSDASIKNEPITVDSSDGIPLIKHDSDLSLGAWNCDYCRRWRGMIFAVLSALFFSFQALLVAKIRHVHFAEITFFRMLVQAICITPVVFLKKQSFIGEKQDWLKLIFRAIFGTISMGGVYFAIQNMPVGEASVIRFSCPAFVGIMAFFILKETCGIFEFVIVLLTFSGVILIAQPPFVFGEMHQNQMIYNNMNTTFNETDIPEYNISSILSDREPVITVIKPIEPQMTMQGRLLGSATALVAAIAGACVHILLRQLRHVDASTVIFTYSVTGAILAAFITTCVSSWSFMMDAVTWVELLGVGVNAVIAQLCFTWSLQEENAGTVSVLRTTEIVFAFIYQTTLLKLYPNIYSIIGAILIASSAVGHGIRKWYNSRLDFYRLDEAKCEN